MIFKATIALITWILIFFSLRGSRHAFFSLLLLALFYFPAKVGFSFNPGIMDLRINTSLILVSLQNYPHIVLFALFYIMTRVQLGEPNRKIFILAGIATMIMGIYVELAQWITGKGHCRLRDLIPDGVGVLVGFLFEFGRMKWNQRTKNEANQ